jgi:flagellum-specific ATP synthase
MVAATKDNQELRLEAIQRCLTFRIQGRISGITGLTVEVADFAAPIGGQCNIVTRNGRNISAEVIGFRHGTAILMPLDEMLGIACGDKVYCLFAHASVPIGDQLLGRVIDGRGLPIDGKGPLLCQVRRGVTADRLEPLQRTRIDAPIGTGIRAVDAMMTCGLGQRMGIFSGPGVGKSVLLGMISRYTSADVCVIALVGERGREVREFIEKDLGSEGLSRAVVVVSTSDEPPPIRVRAGFVATTIAEHFRDQGRNVLLLMDSVTRIAMAQRQIGLAVGEPPATKGFTPSVFALLPRLLERCGRSSLGSITGFYTVLVEGDDFAEPISDAMRGILDGHLSLSRHLANRRHYPAIDMLDSISRVMVDIVGEQHLQAAREVIRLIAIYRDIEDLVNIGAYAPGTNAEFDQAVQAQKAINQFLQQSIQQRVTFAQAVQELKVLGEVIKRGPTQNNASRKTAETPPPAPRQPSPGLERMMAGL